MLKIEQNVLMIIYFPCRSERRGKLEHILNWFKIFIDMHNRSIIYTHAKLTQHLQHKRL